MQEQIEDAGFVSLQCTTCNWKSKPVSLYGHIETKVTT